MTSLIHISSFIATPAVLSAARKAYCYPAAYLVAPPGTLSIDTFSYSRPVEAVPVDERAQPLTDQGLLDYHHALLTSSDDIEVVLGICSVTYWGNYLVKGRPNFGLAVKRVDRFLRGNKKSPRCVGSEGVALLAAHVRQAKVLLDAGEPGDALESICMIPWLSIAFGTKVLAFLAPDKAGVYDIHISRAMGIADDLRPTGYLSARGKKAFDIYCRQLVDIAAEMNKQGIPPESGAWQAVDVERAIFAVMTRKPSA